MVVDEEGWRGMAGCKGREMLREVIKLNSARRAHREGRYLDALELLEDPLIADHRKAQALREKVLAALKARGVDRKDAGQLTLALTDLTEVAERRPDDDAREDGNEVEKMRAMRDEDQAHVRALYFKARLAVEQGDLAQAALIMGVVPDEARTSEFRTLWAELKSRQSEARAGVDDVMNGRIDLAQQDAVLDDAEKRWALCPDIARARNQVAISRCKRAVGSKLSHGAFLAFVIEHGLYKNRYLKSLDAATIGELDAPLSAEVTVRVDQLLEEGKDKGARRLLLRQREYLAMNESDEILRLGVDDLSSARHLLDTGDHAGARSRAECALGRLGRRRAVVDVLSAIDAAEKLSVKLIGESRLAMDEGDLDRAGEVLEQLQREYPNHVLARSLEEVIAERLDARRVALESVQANLGAGRVEEARRELLQMRLQGDRSPDISNLLSDCVERERELFTLSDDEGSKVDGGILGHRTPSVRRGVPHTWMLSVEERGEYLVFEKDEILIGNAVGGAADLSIMAPIATRHAIIERRSGFHEGVRYAITAVDGHDVKVNGKHETSCKLSHGDDVELGTGLRFCFSAPSERSRAAMLLLQDGLQVEGSRQIVLMPSLGRAGAVLVGGGGDLHIDIPGVEGVLEIFREPDSPRLHVRSAEGVAVDGQPSRSQETVGVGSFFVAGPISGAIRAVDS